MYEHKNDIVFSIKSELVRTIEVRDHERWIDVEQSSTSLDVIGT